MLEVKNLTWIINHNGKANTILEDITFNVERGGFLSILGPSGCGKTTLLRSIGGYELLPSGEIILDGKRVEGPGNDRVMVFQTFEQLFAWKTVQGNVEYPLQIQRLERSQLRERAAYYLELVGLTPYVKYYPHQLSGGMKQRTALARALALEPKVLLMDEPFSAVDALTRQVLQEELLKIWEHFQTTILFVTHDIEEAIKLSQRVLVMNSNPGRVKNIIDNNLELPRNPDMKGFASMWKMLYAQLEYGNGGKNDPPV